MYNLSLMQLKEKKEEKESFTQSFEREKADYFIQFVH